MPILGVIIIFLLGSCGSLLFKPTSSGSITVKETSVHGRAGPTTSSFLDSLKGRDDAAWRRLASVYARLVLYWCRCAGVAREDRVDVCQDVFRAVAAGIDTFHWDEANGSFRGWLRTITRSKVADHFRRRNRQPEGPGGTDAQQRLLAIPGDDPSSDPEATDRERAIVINRTLELIRPEFEDRTWQAFWGTTVEDRRSDVVGEALGMTPGAVRQAKSRVLRRLREELRDLLELESCGLGEERGSCRLIGRE